MTVLDFFFVFLLGIASGIIAVAITFTIAGEWKEPKP
jgi:hypothetical protein